MSALTAIGIFIGIPAALAVVIWLFVSIGTWRKGDEPIADGTFVWSDPPAPDPGRLPSEDVHGRFGGARGTW